MGSVIYRGVQAAFETTGVVMENLDFRGRRVTSASDREAADIVRACRGYSVYTGLFTQTLWLHCGNCMRTKASDGISFAGLIKSTVPYMMTRDDKADTSRLHKRRLVALHQLTVDCADEQIQRQSQDIYTG